MKKIISTLAALSIICGSIGTAAPAFAETVLTETASISTEEFDLDGGHSTAEADGITYNVYTKFATIAKVDKEDIEEFTVPETYKELPVVGFGIGPFEKCKKLKKINMSKNTAVLDWLYIAEEGLEEITVPEDNKYFTAVDGVIYTKDMKELVACPNGNGKTELTISDETVSIDRGALACCRDLKKVTMGKNVEKIYPSAFCGCSGLTEVNFSQKLKAVGYMAFAGCSSLESVDLPDSLEEMYEDVFRDTACVETEDGIKYVDNWAVGSDKDIEDGDIRKGTVGTVCGLFTARYKLRNIYVPSSVKHITQYLVSGLGEYLNIDCIDFYNDAIPERCFATNGIKSIRIFDPNCKIIDSKTALPPYWVERDDSLTPSNNEEEPIEYKLGARVTVVHSPNGGSNTIQKAINTELIELDESINITASDEDVSKDDEYVQKMAALDEKDNSGFAIAQPVDVKVKSAPIKIGAATKYDTIIYGIEGSTAEDYAVKYRRIFKPLELRSSIGNSTTIHDDDAGVTYNRYTDTYATAKVNINNGDKIKEITIAPEANGAPVKDISVPRANADIINIPATVQRYVQQKDSAEDKVAYYNVDKDNPYLTSVDGIIYTKDMTKLIKVPSRYAGKKIVVPDGVKIIDSFAFYSLDNVESIELPDSVETIGICAFMRSNNLKSVKLSKNLDVIGDSAFMYCTKLTDITLPESVNQIGLDAFNDVPAVEFENSLGYLGTWLVDTNKSMKQYVEIISYSNDERVPPTQEVKIFDKELSSNEIVPREGTTGIASIAAGVPIVIPKSVTKMSWEMIGGNAPDCTRAEVYSNIIDFDAFKYAEYIKDIYIYDPECKICAGSQTIPAFHNEIESEMPWDKVGFMSSSCLTRTFGTCAEGNCYETVIHGYAGSTAEAYAKMYGVKFEEIDTSTAYKNGDLNGDGALNVADLVMMSRFIKGMTSLDEAQTKSADLNGDGNVDIFDMVEFRKKILESMRDN